MPNADKTEVLVILDASGSMGKDAVEASTGLNSFIEKQAGIPGECLVTVVLFNSVTPYKVVVDRVLAKDVPKFGPENYKCTGWTPLRQCVCQGIDRLGERLASLPEWDRPGKVVVVIVTDGEENASAGEYTEAATKQRIALQEQTYSWQFVFLGKNIDARAESTRIGISAVKTADFRNYGAAFNKMSAGLESYRTKGSAQALSFSDADRAVLMAD